MGQSLRRFCQETVRRCFGLKSNSQEISILNQKQQSIQPQDEERKIMACTIDVDDNLEEEDDSQFSAEWTAGQKENNGIKDCNYNNQNQIEDVHAVTQKISQKSDGKQQKLVKIGVFDEEIGKTKQQEMLEQDPDYFTTMESMNAQPEVAAQIFHGNYLSKNRENNDEEEQGRFEKLGEEHDFNATSGWVDDIQIEL